MSTFSSATPPDREPKALFEVALNRVGTCMAWQWMCPHDCDYVLGISADREDIAANAVRHLRACHG